MMCKIFVWQHDRFMKIFFFWLLDWNSLSYLKLQFALADATSLLLVITSFAAIAHFLDLQVQGFHSFLTGTELRKFLARWQFSTNWSLRVTDNWIGLLEFIDLRFGNHACHNTSVVCSVRQRKFVAECDWWLGGPPPHNDGGYLAADGLWHWEPKIEGVRIVCL